MLPLAPSGVGHLWQNGSIANSIELAAAEAIREIRDVLEDRMILRVTRRQGSVTRTMTYTQDADVSPPSAEETEYVWSGPRV